MIYPNHLDYEKFLIDNCGNLCGINICTFTWQGILPSEWYGAQLYIGVTDKNNKDIYEGDIIHLTSSDGIDYHAQIIFKDGGFCAIDGTEDDYSFRRYDLSRFDLVVEVVGNICENPELMKLLE
jgi:uncharacterized phage protein (TIGR01671 family)